MQDYEVITIKIIWLRWVFDGWLWTFLRNDSERKTVVYYILLSYMGRWYCECVCTYDQCIIIILDSTDKSQATGVVDCGVELCCPWGECWLSELYWLSGNWFFKPSCLRTHVLRAWVKYALELPINQCFKSALFTYLQTLTGTVHCVGVHH